MHIRENFNSGGSDGTRELRVKIGVDYHLKLHTLKILRNKNMSTTVEEALDHYFKFMAVNESLKHPGDAPTAPPHVSAS